MNSWAIIAGCAAFIVAVVALGLWQALTQARAAGAQTVTTATTVATAAVETAVAQAEVAAPVTKDDLMARLEKGSF